MNRIVDHASKVARDYLWGRLLLILALAVLYGIDFTLIGLQHAIFLAVFAAIFSIVPYIGNIIGIVLPVLVALANQGAPMAVGGMLVVFAVAQFVESYRLEPLIVGSQVNLNPFLTIVAVVAGGFLWGIAGLILAIPIVGIARVICANVGPLQPYGYLLGEQQETSHSAGRFGKIKHVFGL